MRIKKRIAALLMAGTMVCSTLPVNALAMENSNQENLGSPTQQECVCTTLCTAEKVNKDCELCGAEGFGICMGKGADEQADTLPSAEEAMPVEEQQVYEALQAQASTEDVEYLDEKGSKQTANSVTEVKSSTTTWDAGWYVVNSTVTIDRRVTVSGDVHLILADNANLTVNGGSVTATGGREAAGIGGGKKGSGGNITINGGSVTATGRYKGAGIGGGREGSGGTVTISGGSVTATGGQEAAGIGGGHEGSGGTVTISGGSVTATGGGNGAGIGGGQEGSGGTVTINGGSVTATGRLYGAGIGGGDNGNGGTITINGGSVAATGGDFGGGIGGGYNGSGGNITINGGSVAATGGYKGAGIGSGQKGSGGTITIQGGSVTATGGQDAAGVGSGNGGSGVSFTTGTDGHALIIANGGITDQKSQGSWSGIIFEGNTGKVYGNPTIQENIEIPSGKTLTVPKNTTLTVKDGVTLTNNGTIQNNGTINGTINGTVEGDNPLLPPVSYRTCDENGKNWKTKSCSNYTVVKSSMTEWNNGWYVVSGAVTIDSRVTVNGTVHLILADNAKLTVEGGIKVAEGNSFSVYAQSVEKNMGTLTTTGGQEAAGIGGGKGGSGGTITINGGSVTATGGNNAAGIGGGWGGSGGTITMAVLPQPAEMVQPESAAEKLVLVAQSPSTVAVLPQPAESMEPESVADIMVLVAQSPSTVAVSPQPAEVVQPESAADIVDLAATPLQLERAVML